MEQPALFLLSGLPGAGKTTFAQQLCSRTGAEHVESDAIRRGIAPEPRYTPRESGIVFALAERRVRAAIAGGRSVVLDATNLTNRDRRRFVRAAAEMEATLVAIRVVAPEEVIPLETLRLGLRGDTFFQYLPEEVAAKLRQV
jgi:predicted kinase